MSASARPGEIGDAGGRELVDQVGELVPTLRERGDELMVDAARLAQQIQQAVQQSDVAARLDGQVEVGFRGGRVAPGIDHDHLGAALYAVEHAQVQDRMAVGHVGADDEEQVRPVHVLIGPGRPVRAERQLVARSRARHAQTRVGLDVVGADETLGEFVGEILRFERHLAGDVKAQRVRAVRVADRAEAAGGLGDGVVDGDSHEIADALVVDIGAVEPAGRLDGEGARRAFGAEAAEVGGVVLVAADLDDRVVLDVQLHTAAHAAIGADRFDYR